MTRQGYGRTETKWKPWERDQERQKIAILDFYTSCNFFAIIYLTFPIFTDKLEYFTEFQGLEVMCMYRHKQLYPCQYFGTSCSCCCKIVFFFETFLFLRTLFIFWNYLFLLLTRGHLVFTNNFFKFVAFSHILKHSINPKMLDTSNGLGHPILWDTVYFYLLVHPAILVLLSDPVFYDILYNLTYICIFRMNMYFGTPYKTFSMSIV